MTKKRLRFLSFALLSLMIILVIYFCLLAIPSLSASADSAGIEYILNDVEYHTVESPYENYPQISYFTGYRGDPTVGTYFAYAVRDYYTGYALPTSWTDLIFDPSDLYTFEYMVLSTEQTKVTGYNFTISFDCVGGGYVQYVDYEDVRYKLLGYFNFKSSLNSTVRFAINFLLNEDTNTYYLRGTATSSNAVFVMTALPDFSASEGEFISMSFAYPIAPDYAISCLTVRMPCSRNFYSTANFNNSKVKNKDNQNFLNSFSLASYTQNLYHLDNIFASMDESISLYISEALKVSYENGYSAGLIAGNKIYNNGNLGNFSDGVSWLSSLFTSTTKFFSIKIFGDITLATVIFIPLILSILLFILKLVRG